MSARLAPRFKDGPILTARSRTKPRASRSPSPRSARIPQASKRSGLTDSIKHAQPRIGPAVIAPSERGAGAAAEESRRLDPPQAARQRLKSTRDPAKDQARDKTRSERNRRVGVAPAAGMSSLGRARVSKLLAGIDEVTESMRALGDRRDRDRARTEATSGTWFRAASPVCSVPVPQEQPVLTLPTSGLRVGRLEARCPSPARFFRDRCEYAFHHPY